MTGYLCATPYHILAATALASGLCKDDENILVVLDHFDFDETLADKIRNTGIFDKVLLYKSNKKTRLNNVKRLVNAFIAPKLVKTLAKTDFDRFFCFALDFIDITYLMKKSRKRGNKCNFSFADDGLGSYLNDSIYKPRRISEIILKLCGRYKMLGDIKKLYVYKPEYVVANKQFEIEKIPQNEETTRAQTELCRALWPLNDLPDTDGKILYFEQPYDSAFGDAIIKKEQQIIRTLMQEFNLDCRIKMHPRSFGDKKWQDFGVIETKMPMEAMLLQTKLAPLVMMTNYSTASFAAYLLDNVCMSDCPTVLVFGCIEEQDLKLSSLIEQFIEKVNSALSQKSIFSPRTETELIEIFRKIKVR